MWIESFIISNHRLLGVAEQICNKSLGLISRLLSRLLPALAHGTERRLELQPMAKRTALLLIDVQPEWFSESEISQIFPWLRETIPKLSTTYQAAGALSLTIERVNILLGLDLLAQLYIPDEFLPHILLRLPSLSPLVDFPAAFI